MDLELKDKTAFVAASSKGLGLACAEQFLNEGANVTVSSRNESNLQDAVEHLESECDIGSDQLLSVRCDVSDRSSIEDAIQSTVDEFGGIDVQVNNHGGPPSVSFEDATEEQWDNAYKNVVKSNRWLAEESLPHLQRSDVGSLTVVTSASARESPKNHALSNMYRLSLYGLVKTISREYGPDVRANAATPRFIMTDRVEARTKSRAENRGISLDEAFESRVNEVSLNRPGDPSEFGNSVVYLSSPKASYITGEVLSIDGGWSRYVL